MALTRHAHSLLRDHFKDKPKNIAVDATCGNGHDTEFLARLGFQTVIGFDVQQQAIEETSRRLFDNKLEHCQLVQAGHETLNQHINSEIDCIMFNLGYLPHADKNITTNKNSTLDALNQALDLLSKHGLISLMCYPGHPQGAIETNAIEQWIKQLDQYWISQTHLSKSPKPTAPILHLIKAR